jgi:outer membrane receptor protein involved in Fe transport
VYQINSKSSLKAALLLGAATATAMSLSTSAVAADQPVETVIVTGSLIPTPNATSNSPIQTVGAEQIDLSGHPNVEQILNTLPQIVPGLGMTSNNPGGGEAVVDLRGLSPNRNLVLVDGRRAMPTQLTGEVDVDTIPAALIDHVDIVTGGGSATYGSDAISGVVNFILKKDFEGFQANARFGEDFLHGDAQEKELNLTMGVNTGDGKGNVTMFAEFYKRDRVLQSVSSLFDLDFGNGSATSPAGRADGGQGLPSIPMLGGAHCGSSSSTYGFGANGNPHGFCNHLPFANQVGGGTDPKANALFPSHSKKTLALNGDRFNFAPLNDLIIPATRHNLAAMGHYDIFPGIEAFGSFHFTNIQDSNQLAPTPVTNLPAPLGFHIQPKAACLGVGTVPGNGVRGCDPALTSVGAYTSFLNNPDSLNGVGTTAFITPAFQADIDLRTPQCNPNIPRVLPAPCVTSSYAPLAFRIRTLQLGPRLANFTTNHYQMTGGLKGPLPFFPGWDWEAYYDFGHADFTQLQDHNVLQSHLDQALLGCPTGSAVGCAPIDVFGPFNLNKWQTVNGGVPFSAAAQAGNPGLPLNTLSAAKFIDYSTHTFNDYSRQLFHFGTHGNIGDYWGAGPISLALGGEWRRDEGHFNPDSASQAFDIQGFTPALKTGGSFDVWEIFGETRVPIITDAPFAKELTLDAGFRFSRYSNAGDADTWKAGAEWQPIDDIRGRVMWQRALRAPNIFELFNGGTQGFPAISDPCAVGGPQPAAFCTAQFKQGVNGTSSEPWTAGYQQVNGQSEEVSFGNASLKPETSNTFTAGVVVTPTFLPDVTASVDFWRISVDRFIGLTGIPTIEAQCQAKFNAVGSAAFVPFATLGQTTATSPCAFVARQADGELVFNVPVVNQPGTLSTSGVDLQLTVTHEVADLLDEQGDWGALDLNVAVEFLTKFLSNTGSSFKGKIDDTSPADFTAGAARPNYKFDVRVGYTLGDWRAVVTWNEYGRLIDDATPRHINIRPYDKVDLAIRWNFSDKYSADFIVNNVFDVNPPIGPYSLAGGINTLNNTYDVLGTQGFIGLTAKL